MGKCHANYQLDYRGYRINFEQLCANTSSREGFTKSRKDGELEIIEEDFKYSEKDDERFIPIKLIANQNKLYAKAFITLPVNLDKTDEIDVLKVLGRMNHEAGSCCSYFDADEKKN